MSRAYSERWEVRLPGATTPTAWPLDTRGKAVDMRERLTVMIGDGLRIVHVRAFRVESVYAWRKGNGWWCVAGIGGVDGYPPGWGERAHRARFVGDGSRGSAKASALAARPSADSVLVRIRRRAEP